MERIPRRSTSRPASGGVIRLQGRLTNLRTWIGPAWATVCGVAASGEFGWQGEDWLRLALLLLLVDGGWGSLWAALGSTDWATPLRRWYNWRYGNPVTRVPYTLPGSPGDRLSQWLGQLHAWAEHILWPTCGRALASVIVALPVTVVLAALLGTKLLLLSAAALAIMQLGVAWENGRGTVAPRWNAIVTVTLPWLAGHLAFEPLTLSSTTMATLFALAWGAAWRVETPSGRATVAGAQFAAAVFLVALHRPLAVALLALSLAPQLVLLPWLGRDRPASWYAQYTQPWLMTAMLVAALAL